MKPIFMFFLFYLPCMQAKSLHPRGPPAKVTVNMYGPGKADVYPGSTHGLPTGNHIPIDWHGPGHFQQTYEHPKRIQAMASLKKDQLVEMTATGHRVQAVSRGTDKNTVGEVQANSAKKKRLKVMGRKRRYLKVKEAGVGKPAMTKTWLRGPGSVWIGASGRKSPSPGSSPTGLPESPEWSSGTGSMKSLDTSSSSSDSATSAPSEGNQNTSATSHEVGTSS